MVAAPEGRPPPSLKTFPNRETFSQSTSGPIGLPGLVRRPDLKPLWTHPGSADRHISLQLGSRVLHPGCAMAKGVSSQLSGVNSSIYIDTEFNHSSPGYHTFLSDVSKYDPGYSDRTDEVLRTYLAFKEFAYAASHAQSQTRSGILSEMKSLTFDTNGLTPPINYSTAQTGLGGHAPSVYADTIWLEKYQNGAFTPIGSTGVNVFTGSTE
jgi:hypothetical protein